MIFNFYLLLNSVLVGIEVEAEAEVEKQVRKIFFYSVVTAFMSARIKLRVYENGACSHAEQSGRRPTSIHKNIALQNSRERGGIASMKSRENCLEWRVNRAKEFIRERDQTDDSFSQNSLI